MAVMGGWVRAPVNDTWVVVNAATAAPSWKEVILPGALPQGRYFHTATYDERLNRMIVFAGLNPSFVALNDVWVVRDPTE